MIKKKFNQKNKTKRTLKHGAQRRKPQRRPKPLTHFRQLLSSPDRLRRVSIRASRLSKYRSVTTKRRAPSTVELRTNSQRSASAARSLAAKYQPLRIFSTKGVSRAYVAASRRIRIRRISRTRRGRRRKWRWIVRRRTDGRLVRQRKRFRVRRKKSRRTRLVRVGQKYRLKLAHIGRVSPRAYSAFVGHFGARLRCAYLQRRKLLRVRGSTRQQFLQGARIRRLRHILPLLRAIAHRKQAPNRIIRRRKYAKRLPSKAYRRKKSRKLLRRWLRERRTARQRYRLTRTKLNNVNRRRMRRRIRYASRVKTRWERNTPYSISKRIYRRWARKTPLLSRRRPSRRSFAGLFGKKRWRPARRDKKTTKRSRGRASAQFGVLQQTRFARTDLRNRQHRISRGLKLTLTRKSLTAGIGAYGVSAAFSRNYFRYLVKKHKLRNKVRGLPAVYTLSSKRLDARVNNLKSYHAKTVYRVSALPDVKNSIVEASIITKHTKRILSQGDARFLRWKFGRSANKLLVQRQLRGASTGEVVAGTLRPASAVKHALLQRGLSAADQKNFVHFTHLGRNNLLAGDTAHLASMNTKTSEWSPFTAVGNSGTILVRINEKARGYKPSIRSFGFLGRSATAYKQKYTLRELKAVRAFSLKRRQHRALRLCRRRPKMRLPKTPVTRARRRKRGLVTFVRNSLKQQRTTFAKQKSLLPPVTSYSHLTKSFVFGYTQTNAMLPYDKKTETHPVFWRRRPSRVNILPVNRQRRKKQYRALRYKYTTRRAIQRRLRPKLERAPTALSLPQSGRNVVDQKMISAALIRKTLQAEGGPFVNERSVLRFVPRSAKSFVKLESLVRPATIIRRTGRYTTPALSRVSVVSTLQSTRADSVVRKLNGLWQVRSVSSMLSAERSLSAWSPQMSTRNRRRHFPRVNGIPTRRRRLSFKARRDRRQDNIRRLQRGIPQIRYTNYAPIKLQFFYGSVGTAGYVRYRRVHRMHSSDSRWWRPNKQGTPFAHPYSRRDLNATRYKKVAFSGANTAASAVLTRLAPQFSGTAFRTKFPARTIPWRNFSYPAPRKGKTPKLLKRWTFTSFSGRTGLNKQMKRRITIKRPVREIHSLHAAVSSHGVWKNKRWRTVDAVTLGTLNSSYLYSALASIPQSSWVALRDKAGSISSYVAVRHEVLRKLRAWIRKRQLLSTNFSAQVQADTQHFLVGLLRSVLASNNSIAATLASAQQHSNLRANAFVSRVSIRADRYLNLHELVKIAPKYSTDAMTQRENSKVYKHWLAGAERELKRSQHGYTPTRRSRYTDNVSTSFGRRRLRFPASGRRRKSYDSLLHAFAKKVAPAQFRRASSIRFRRIRPKLTGDFKENVAAFTPTARMLRRRRTLQNTPAISYLSEAWRELVTRRPVASAAITTTGGLRNSAKRRFLALPTQRVFILKRRLAKKQRSLRKHPMYAVRRYILRRALRARRKERAFVDLRHALIQRRLPREKAKGFRKMRRALRRRVLAKRGAYSPSRRRRRKSRALKWALEHLSAVHTRKRNIRRVALPDTLTNGEIVTIRKAALRRNRKAVRGFVLPLRRRKMRKLRRRNRDSEKRRRKSRRRAFGQRGSIRNISHWSEKKDQHVRHTAFVHKFRGLVGKFSKKIRNRLDTQSATTVSFYSRRLSVNSRLSGCRTAMGLARVTAPTADGITEPSSALMTAMSSLNRRIRIKQQTKVSRFSRIQVEHNKMRGRASKKRSFRDALASFKAKNTSSIPSRLVTSVTRFSPVTPLLFQQPITQAVKSAAKKEQEALAALAAKEERFKLTAQYVESVTALIPDLMNYMLSRRIENTKVTYNTAKHLVKNIYWSLRVYLNVDPFDTRFFIRDKVPAVRVRLFENISDLAESQKTLQPQRAELRYRFQPSKLLLAPNTMRFRKDWLRAFFPAKHALYQENEEDYGKFLLETDKIRSFRFGPRGMDTWITTHQVVGQETRARQLLRLRCSKRRPRFETVLQTTRRAPVLERAPANAATHTKDSFFRRKFSTYSGRSLSLVSSWMHRRKRFISLEDTWRTLSPITLVGARNRTIARVEARGRTGYVGAKRAGLTISTLDGRFARAKSPRSRQYILRSQKKLIDAERPDVSAKLQFYKNLLEERFQAQHTGRILRWTRAKRAHVGYAFKRFTEQSPVATLRTKQHFRRAQTVAATSARMQQNSKTKRPLIRYRSASARTSSVRYRKGVAVPAHSVFANTQYLALLKAQRKNSKIKRRSRAHIRKTWTLFPRRLRHSSLNAKGNLFHRKTVSHRALNYKSYFHSEARRYFLRTLDFTRAVGLYKRFYRQAPFEIHRSRLWNRLTRRWMKKHRIARYWLRDAIHWLKDPWLSQIVAPDMGLRRDRYGGELRSIPQQVGEYVAEVDAQGRDIKRKDAPARERHKYQELMPVLSPERDPEIKKTNKNLKRGSAVTQMITRHRLQIAAEARRKPVPTMRLANYEYRDVIREHKENYAKSAKQKEEEEKARVTAYWARKAKKLPPVRPKRLPLKHPANLWLPHVIWKEIQRRIKKFEWRESDDVFVRAGMRNAFRFRPNERRATPWLEHLMYTRATYSTRLAEFRRRQFPHEQKKFKWLQRVRKVLYSPRTRYFKRKRWPQLRRYNQKLHYSLFKLRDRGAARKHFKKVAARSRPAISAYIAMSKGLTDRLDVTCLQMGFAPTIYWARIVSEFGLLRVNGRTVYNPAYRLKPADVIYPNWDTVIRFQHYFMPQMRRRALRLRKNRMLASFYPKNMEYHKGTRAIIYKHAPDESDLRRSSRIRPAYFRWFRLDSV